MSRTLRPLAALAIVALIGAGCSNESDENGSAGDTNAASQEQAVKFAECMRDNGITEFPDPDASGELTIDGVVNGSSLDTARFVCRYDRSRERRFSSKATVSADSETEGRPASRRGPPPSCQSSHRAVSW